MSLDRVRVGFVGLGHNGLAHVRAHLESSRSQVVALCDRNAERLRAAGAEFGIRKLYADDEFYGDPQIDAISINTGDNDHAQPFLKALAARKHIFVEKPLANSEADVQEMVRAVLAADRRLKIQVGYILRFNPVHVRLHELARSGRLGEIYYMEGDYIHNLLDQGRPERTDPTTGRNWYLEQEVPLVGGGSHPLDILRWISGKRVARVVGYSNHVAFPQMKNDDCQVCLFQYEDGAVAKVAALYAPRCAMAPYNNLRVYGTMGTVERDTVALSSSQADVHPLFEPVEAERLQGHPYLPEIDDWLDAIAEDREPRTPLLDAAHSTIAALCAARAIREGNPVEVPRFPDHVG